jgi:hypothetical protein
MGAHHDLEQMSSDLNVTVYKYGALLAPPLQRHILPREYAAAA